MKAGEVMGGRFAAQDAIAANASNIANSSAQTGVSAQMHQAIMYEENAHQMPPDGGERLIENIAPNSVKHGIGAMQVSSSTSHLSNQSLLNDTTNVSAAGAILQSLQSNYGNDPAILGAWYNSSGGPENAHGQAYGHRVASYTNQSLSPTVGDRIVRSIASGISNAIFGSVGQTVGYIKNSISSISKK